MNVATSRVCFLTRASLATPSALGQVGGKVWYSREAEMLSKIF